MAHSDKNTSSFQNLDVERSANGSTIWIPLPRVAWQCCGRCQCAECDDRVGFWDTLAIPVGKDGVRARNATFLVHMPEGHPFHDVDRNHGFGTHSWTNPESNPLLAEKVRTYVELHRRLGIVDAWETEHLAKFAVAP